MERLRRAALFLLGVIFASVLLRGGANSPSSTAAAGLILWLSFYPFAASLRSGTRSYWVLLVVGVPGAVAARHMEGLTQRLQWIVMAIFVVAVVGAVARAFRRHELR